MFQFNIIWPCFSSFSSSSLCYVFFFRILSEAIAKECFKALMNLYCKNKYISSSDNGAVGLVLVFLSPLWLLKHLSWFRIERFCLAACSRCSRLCCCITLISKPKIKNIVSLVLVNLEPVLENRRKRFGIRWWKARAPARPWRAFSLLGPTRPQSTAWPSSRRCLRACLNRALDLA